MESDRAMLASLPAIPIPISSQANKSRTNGTFPAYSDNTERISISIRKCQSFVALLTHAFTGRLRLGQQQHDQPEEEPCVATFAVSAFLHCKNREGKTIPLTSWYG